MSYDAIIVGARCAGAPTAMLLARAGLKVLVVDRSTFPSDTLSTHVIQPQGIAALARWGILDRLAATGCPAIDTYVFDFGPITISGSPGTSEMPLAYCPRRTVLDKLLVDAAADAGAEIREGFSVDEVTIEEGRVTGIRGRTRDGKAVTETAKVVIGADGRNSIVARAVKPAMYAEKPELLSGHYAYWSGLPMRGRFETYIRPGCGFAAAETHDGMTMVVGGWRVEEDADKKHDIGASYRALFDGAPEFAERLRHAKCETKIYGGITPNFFRKPFGPGWALVGDAGYSKDPITAQGISDAFRDAELLAAALLPDALRGRPSFEAGLAAYQEARDRASMPMYELTCQIASLQPPPPEMQQVLGAICGKPDAMTAFCRMNAGNLPPPDFFQLAMAH